MTSKVEICNIALSNIHAKSINSLTEGSKEAQYCTLKYDHLLRLMLRKSQWNFAHKQVALALLSDDLFGWVYAYQYPSDCLKMNYLMPDAYRVSAAEDGFVYRPEYYSDMASFHNSAKIKTPYEILNITSNRVVGTDVEQAWGDYQTFEQNPDKWDASFLLAFTWFLASELAIPIVGGDNGRKQREDALSLYDMYMKSALSDDANEQYNGAPRESDYILARK